MCLAAATALVSLSCSGGQTEPPGAPELRFPWAVMTPETSGGLAADDQHFYVGAPFAHVLIAIDRTTHKIAWRAPTDPNGLRYLDGNIVVAGGTVIMGDTDLFGFTPGSGVLKWRYQPRIGYNPGTYGIATDGELVFAGSGSGDVYAVAGESGVERWHTRVSDDPESSMFDPLVDGNTVYVPYKIFSKTPVRGGLVALDAATGAVKWNRALGSLRPDYGSGSSFQAQVTSDLVLVSNYDGRIVALRKSDGVVQWADGRLSELQAYNDARPIVVVGGVVVAGSDTGFLVAYDVRDGTQRWKTQTRRGTVESVHSDGQRIYATDLTGGLTCVDVTTGSLLWTRGVGSNGHNGQFSPYPLIIDDTLVVPGEFGVYGIPAK